MNTVRNVRITCRPIVPTLFLALFACAHARAPSPASELASDAQRSGSRYPTMAPIADYLMDRDAEVALARSAAPPAIGNEASVLVLTPTGYVKAVDGKNGFVCLVGRAWLSPFDDPEFWNAKERSPVCQNAPAVRSALPVDLQRTELALSGRTKEQILARMKALVAEGAFVAPEIGAMSYMMSRHQVLGDTNPHWHPHLMFYMPGEMNASVWGANLPGGSPVYGGGEDLPGGGRLPWTLFLVPVPRWSDGTLSEEHPLAH
jgi:hypothetical protein